MGRFTTRFAILIAIALFASGCGGSERDLSDQAAQGREVAEARGCLACHGDSGEGGIGPAWLELFESEVELESGELVIADAAYLRRSIVEPDAEIVAGVTISMPVTELSEIDVAALVAYIKELR